MSIISIPLPENVGLSLSGQPVEVPVPEQSSGGLPGYRKSMSKPDAVVKCLDPIPGNIRNRIWMCPSLSIYSNYEYVYAIFPIAVALFWGKGGRVIADSRPLSMIFAILSHVLSATALNNYYSVRTTGEWSCEDTMVKGSAPLAPLDD